MQNRINSFSRLLSFAVTTVAAALVPGLALAQEPPTVSDAHLVLPDPGNAHFLGTDGRTLLWIGVGICVLGAGAGLMILNNLRNMPVH
jgi:hypothetical protein